MDEAEGLSEENRERTLSGETWMGVPVAAYLWDEPTNLDPPSSQTFDRVAFHWSTGPAHAERLYRESDVRRLLNAARAESRSTPDREELEDWCRHTVEVAERVKAELGPPNCQVFQTEEDRARIVAYRYGYQVGMTEATKDVQAILARPASSAGGGEGALKDAVIRATRKMPRRTPASGGGSTVHTFEIEAGVVWELDGALTNLDRAISKGADRG